MWLDHYQNPSDGAIQHVDRLNITQLPITCQANIGTLCPLAILPKFFLSPPVRANPQTLLCRLSPGHPEQLVCAYCVHGAPQEDAGHSRYSPHLHKK